MINESKTRFGERNNYSITCTPQRYSVEIRIYIIIPNGICFL